jgi:hypothetical protein
MVSVSVRSLLVPGVAVVAASAVALGSALVAPPTVTLSQPTVAVPSVHIEDIQLAGIGVDLYQAIQPWVQYGVDLAIWGTLWIPPVSSQIDILYYAGSLPLVSTTVYALADIVSNPLNFFGILGAYGAALGVIGYNFVAAELSWLGIPVPPLPPLPPIAATKGSSAPPAAARTARAPRAVAATVSDPSVATDAAADVPAPTEVATDVAAEVRVPARAVRGQARSAVAGAARAARSAAAEVPAAVQQASEEVSAAAQTAVTEIRNTAQPSGAAKSAREARGAVRAAADAAN